MGKDIRLGLVVGCGLIAAIVIFWAVQGRFSESTIAEMDDAALSEEWVAEEDATPVESEGIDEVDEDEYVLVATIQGMPDDEELEVARSASLTTSRMRERATAPAPARIEREAPVETIRKPATVVAAAPERKLYTVERGDNLFKIAKKFYNDGNQWRAIHQANIASLPNANRLKQGQVLEIPQQIE